MNKRSKTLGYYYEKFRTFLLILLISVCIIQVGILWSSQSGSFPFLSSFFFDSKTAQASIEEMKGHFMLPCRVVLSKGYDGDHLIIPNGSKEYYTLWNGAQEYLKAALKDKPTRTEPFNEEKWGIIAANNPYYFEFKTDINIDIVKWVLNIKNSVDSVMGLNKVVVYPDDPENGYSDTIYIKDNNNIYTYIVSGYGGAALDQKEFETVYESHKNNFKIKNYKIAIETGSKSLLPKDMIAPFTSNSEEEYTNLNSIPFGSLQGPTSSLAEYDAIQLELLGEIRNDYYPDEDVYGAVVFKKSDSVYRLYKNSVIEYKYTGNQGVTERTRLLDAYQKAVGFIMELKARSRHMDNINLYLSSVKEGSNSFIFKFDYSIDDGEGHGDVPLLLKDFKLPNSEQSLDSAITIEATSKRVIQCRWVALKLEVNKIFKEYTWNFPELVDRAYSLNKELSNANLPIRDYGIYYVLTPPEANSTMITPSFVLFNNTGSYDIPLGGK
ncbi:hypothetical protein [Ruminiclostridium cellobioparum]|uniref:hypothetical protein n=1 Tax=Ruminiclostridium cellobioparum TaxID=29355 RepID=UPI0028A64163|nr:hypothetical protein [Ruminiclostridium cellobioparum]